ncbi:MAG: thiolase family protein [Elusimicrobiota bacterium]
MERIAIVGVAQTKFSAPRVDKTFADLVYEVTTGALKDAGLEIADIDNIVTVSNDFWDGRTISSMAVGDAAGAAFGRGKNISTVEGDGTLGALYGLTRILSGSYQNTLVVAHAKASEGDNRLITNAFFDPIFERALGVDDVTAAALQAQVYQCRFGLAREDFAGVAVKNRKNAAKNPCAHHQKELSLSEVMNSPDLAPPINALEARPLSDGAAAIILASENFAKKLARRPAWVAGVGSSAEDYRLGERTLWKSPSLSEAAQRAYAVAGVREPSKEIQVAEISEFFAHQELLWSENLGFCAQGEGGRLLQSGQTQATGALPINPSGGCLGACAPLVAGLVRIIEATLQLRGEAATQVREPRLALAHGQNGLAGQSHCVWILSRN